MTQNRVTIELQYTLFPDQDLVEVKLVFHSNIMLQDIYYIYSSD